LKSVSGWIPAVALALTASLGTAVALAQAAPAEPAQPAPAATSPASAAPSAPSASAPSPLAPPVQAAPVDPLPPANPKAFTATSPTVETVNAFLTQLWGFDPKRVWRVMGIQPTMAEGVSEVVVFVTSTEPDAQVQPVTFYVLPDGKHAIGEGAGVLNFGATPFAATRALLKARANGAARGATSKDLELVEFTDLQCPHCKEAEPTMDQLVKDFPAARVVVQLLPLTEIHSSAFKAAAYGVCAQKHSDEAYFKYAAGVFDTQEALAPATEDTLLRAAAQRAGLDGPAIAACANTQATKDIVNADIQLAADAGVHNTTPTLAVNGRLLPLGIPYETIKQIIVHQAKMDGVATGASADILAPAPPKPAAAAPNSPSK